MQPKRSFARGPTIHGAALAKKSWTQSGNRYTIRCKYTLPDGGTGSNIQVITFIDNDQFTWKSVSREIDGELQPDTDEIILVRKTGELDAQGEK